MFDIVVAFEARGGIGKQNSLPWPNINADLRRFVSLTTNNVVIMGRKTWLSLPKRPLQNRSVYVLTAQSSVVDQCEDTFVVKTLQDALDDAEQRFPEKNIFVAGGTRLYKEAMEHAASRFVYATNVIGQFESDTFFPLQTLNRNFVIKHEEDAQIEKTIAFQFLRYERRPHAEMQYLNIIREILQSGSIRNDRTKTGTLSLFGKSMRFDLRSSFPLLTTKRVFWRGVVEELLWFIRGSTNAAELQARNVRIWDGNASREYLDSVGLTSHKEGDLGPVYGFQWRHFGAEYTNCDANYTNKGVDQLRNVIEQIQTNPTSRRLVMNAWNARDLGKMALPPCHVMCQFFVDNGELSCQMYQRSADMGLGVPFNIASYALLTVMIAHVCKLTPGDFVHVLGDAHVYSNHVDALKKQLQRSPRPFPTLKIVRHVDDIEDFCYEDFEVENYKPHPTIKMSMAV